MHSIIVLATTAALILVLRFMRNVKGVDNLPGMRPLLHPLGLGALLPTRWWNPGLHWIWEWRQTSFFDHTHDVISMVPLLVGAPCYYISSPAVMKQLLNNELKTRLIKPNWLTSTFLLWGDNIFSANGDMWRRHHRILAPAFSPKTYSLVVSETATAYNEMVVMQGWETGESFVVDNFNRLIHKVAVLVTGRCAFGLPISWNGDPIGNDGINLEETLNYVARTRYARVRLPHWIYKLGLKRIDALDQRWKSLGSFMHQFLWTRRTELAATSGGGVQADIFSRLVAAMHSRGTLGFDEQEVIGNAVMLMFGGHETTAAALAATLGFLAIHQEQQDTAYCEIVKAIPSKRDPRLDDFSRMPHLLACFHEALRLFPAVMLIPRETTEDVTIKVQNPIERLMVLKQGSLVIFEMIAIHRNPQAFPDPEKYDPSRWYDVPESDTPMFSLGPRTCIGKKFGQTLAMCFLSLILRDWKVDIILRSGETRSQYDKRVMGKARRVGFAFGCDPLSFSFTRRT